MEWFVAHNLKSYLDRGATMTIDELVELCGAKNRYQMLGVIDGAFPDRIYNTEGNTIVSVTLLAE